MSKYLIALDGSDGSRAAADAVRQIAGKDAEVVLFSALHVPKEIPERSGASIPWRWPGNPEPGPGPGLAETRAQAMDRLREETLTRLETLASELRAAGLRAEADMGFGEPVAEIMSAAERHKADLVVVATHGHTGLRAAVLGSVASELIRARKLPVLVAPLHAR